MFGVIILFPIIRWLTLPLRQRLGYARVHPNVPTWREIEQVWRDHAWRKMMVRVNGELRAVARHTRIQPYMQFLYNAERTGPDEDMREFYMGRTWWVDPGPDNNAGSSA